MPTPNSRTVSFYATGGTSVSYCDTAKTPDLLSKNFGAPVVSYNKSSTSYVSGTVGAAQEFYLPDDYLRVDKIPSLTGVQTYLSINDLTKKVNYELHTYDPTIIERESSHIDIVLVSASAGVVTYTTKYAHNLSVNETVILSGFSTSGYNGKFTVTEIVVPAAGLKSTQFKVKNATTGTPLVYGILLPKILSKSITLSKRKYYQIDQFNARGLIVKSIKKSKNNVYFDFELTKLTKNIKKDSLITFKYTTKPRRGSHARKVSYDSLAKKEGVYKVQKVYTKHKRTYVRILKIEPKTKSARNSGAVDGGLADSSVALDPKVSIISVWSLKDPAVTAMSKIPVISEDIDTNYDSERGWVGLVRGSVDAGKISGNQWFDIKFKSLPILESQLDQKFKLVIYGEGIDKIYYHSLSDESLVQAYSKTGDAPITNAGKSSILFKIFAGVADAGTDFLSNKYRSISVKNGVDNLQTPENEFWSSKPNPSKYGIENLYFDVSTDTEDFVTIDSIFMDPITPGVSFNVYYSNEKRKDLALAEANGFTYTYTTSSDHSFSVGDSVEIRKVDNKIFNGIFKITAVPTTNQFVVTGLTSSTARSKSGNYFKHLIDEDDNSWESLLWEWVPRNFKTNKKQSYIFPNPIQAKYIKIEFSNLQASYYSPGANHTPTLYKKYPEWVLNYFLSIYDVGTNKTFDPIISSQIDIQYDMLNLAFNYYKGDIINPLSRPIVIEDSNSQNNIITNLLKNAATNLANYDMTSLVNINTSFDKFKNHPTNDVKTSTVLGRDAVIKSTKEYFNYLVETVASPQGETANVSTHDRNHLMLEKQMPDMYFYPTCRHAYREAYAKFNDNKAYFVKIKQIKFERNIHNVISDKVAYKFVPGDFDNSEHCDFSLNDKTWTV